MTPGETPSAPTLFERTVLDSFLAGEDPRLQLLREQARACTVIGRRHTSVGAFIELSVPAQVPRVSPPAMTMGDLDLRLVGAAQSVSAMLWVRHGALVLLEFVVTEGEWPREPVVDRVGYLRYVPDVAGGYAQVPTATRDPDTLALQLAGHKSSRIVAG